MPTKDETPLVSVCIASYNRPEGLRKTISSITSQTYKNLEIIISDNCSDGDDIKNLLDRICAHDSRARYFVHKYNHGPTYNFDFLLKQARGEYFMWVADDDDWEPMGIERMLTKMQENKDVVLCYSEACIKKFRGQERYQWPSDMVTSNLSKTVGFRKILLNQHRNTEIFGLMNTNIARLYKFKNFFGEDHVFVMHMALHGSFEKTDPYLFNSSPGCTGASTSSLVRTLKINYLNNYFGYLFQMKEALRLVTNAPRSRFNIIDKAYLICCVFARYSSPLYCDAIKAGLKNFSKKFPWITK